MLGSKTNEEGREAKAAEAAAKRVLLLLPLPSYKQLLPWPTNSSSHSSSSNDNNNTSSSGGDSAGTTAGPQALQALERLKAHTPVLLLLLLLLLRLILLLFLLLLLLLLLLVL